MLQNKWERSSLSLYRLKPQPALGFPELISYVPHCIDKGASRALALAPQSPYMHIYRQITAVEVIALENVRPLSRDFTFLFFLLPCMFQVAIHGASYLLSLLFEVKAGPDTD